MRDIASYFFNSPHYGSGCNNGQQCEKEDDQAFEKVHRAVFFQGSVASRYPVIADVKVFQVFNVGLVSSRCAEELLSGKHCLADAKPLVRWHNLLYPHACSSYQAGRT